MAKRFDYETNKDEIIRLYKKYGSLTAVRMRIGGSMNKLKEVIGEENLKKYKKESVFNKRVWAYEEY